MEEAIGNEPAGLIRRLMTGAPAPAEAPPMAGRSQNPSSLRTAASSCAAVALALAAVVALATVTASEAATKADASAGAPLSAEHRDWLEAIGPLITEPEREAFVGLAQDYRRQAFIEEFWRARDPYPETARNELRERWEAQLAAARQRFGAEGGARLGYFAALGEPSLILPGRCAGVLEPIEIWRYAAGTLDRDAVHLVFRVRHGSDGRRYELWNPSEGLRRLIVSPMVGATPEEQLSQIAAGCFRGDDVAVALTSAVDWQQVREGGVFAAAGDEWLGTFLGRSTELPAGAGTFDARLDVVYPGRYQSRTVLQGMIAVPRGQATVAELGQSRTYELAIDGEVLRKGELFESFRYRFQIPAQRVESDEIPLLFQRHLRPGTYELVVRAHDVPSGRYFRERRAIEVPAPRSGGDAIAWSASGAGRIGGTIGGAGDRGPEDGEDGGDEDPERPTGLAALAALVGSADGGGDGSGARSGAAEEGGPIGGSRRAEIGRSDDDPAAEANASLATDTGEWGIRLLPPPPGLQIGVTRVEAVIAGGDVAGVSFEVDGKPVLRKARPPYSVEVDLGRTPRTHVVSAVAIAGDGRAVARDELVINAGPHRFAVRLVEPQSGRRYASSLRVHAEVDVPEGERLERVEIYLDEDLLATLYQPPFTHPLLLPPGLGTAYVRAVAFLEGGHSAEDLVYVNAPEHLDEIDVRMVELFTSTIDRQGRPVDDLAREDFAVREQGVPQEIRRFERVRDLPLWTALLLDRSQSMVEEIDEVVAGALTFFEQVLTPKDRAAVYTFNHQPDLRVRFTSDPAVLAGGVAGIEAEGGTALFDSLVQALYYFSGVNGKRTLIVISDGDDGGSTYSFDEALDYARRTGVAIYTIGLGLPSRDARVKMQLQRLATESGGRSFFISRAEDLAKVYESIEEELRTQYLLAYQSTYDGSDDGFRQVEIEVARPGVTASTVRGYYP